MIVQLGALVSRPTEASLIKLKITEDLNSATNNHEDIIKWTARIGIIISQLDEKSLRWFELSEGV